MTQQPESRNDGTSGEEKGVRMVAPLTPRGWALAAAVGLSLLSGCTTIGFLQEDEQLYTGAEVQVEAEQSVRGTRALRSDLEEIPTPAPNRTWLGFMRPWLWVYHVVGVPEEPGIRSWIADRFAEEPVLFEQVSPEANAGRMRAWLANHGYFDAEVEYRLVERPSRVGLSYDVFVRRPYRIASLTGPGEVETEDGADEELSAHIRDALRQSLIAPGDVYNLDTLRQERIRIDRILKDRGYYAFSPDFLLFEAYRDHEQRTVDLQLVVKEEAPARARRPHQIGRITVYADHSPGRIDPVTGEIEITETTETTDAPAEELQENFRYIAGDSRLDPRVVRSAILLEPGERYSRALHLATVSRLMSLGVFRFVNIRYESDNETDALHALVYLTRSREKLFEGEIQMVTRSNDFAGPGVRLRYRDRNALGGAEEFRVDVSSGFETRLGTGEASLDSWELGAEVALSLPRVVAPLAVGTRGPVMPRTEISVGVNTLTRLDAYRLDQVSAALGYTWIPRRGVRHQLRPIDLTLVRPGEFSGEFRDVLDRNPGLQRRFEEQFIIGGSYSLFYNSRPTDAAASLSRDQTVVLLNADLAGNLLSGIWGAFSGAYPDADAPLRIADTPYSQFVRIDSDLRYFFSATERSKVAARLLTGAGYAFGNSSELPRVKQFSVGGTNSIRAFQGRTIGPGDVPPESAGGPAVERSGDIRLEANLEYRFPIVGFLKGAMFADAGNIWTLGDDVDETAGAFDPASFLRQTAVGAGVGVRIDPSFFVLRLDVAAPLRKPWLPSGERWVADQIDLTDRDWRRDNLVFNIAIGYPY